MGTSSSNYGPTKKSPLLPSWATSSDSNSSGRRTTDIPTQNITSSKGILTRITNKRKGSTYKTFAKSYIKSAGGAGGATMGSYAGVDAASDYLNFINGASTAGFRETLGQLNLEDYVGYSVKEILPMVANEIAPTGSTDDEAIARTATLTSIWKLYEILVDEGIDIGASEKLSEEHLSIATEEFVSAYIFQKWIYEAGIAFERNELSEAEVVALEGGLRNWIRHEVKVGLSKVDILTINLKQGFGRSLVENIFNQAYKILEQ